MMSVKRCVPTVWWKIEMLWFSHLISHQSSHGTSNFVVLWTFSKRPKQQEDKPGPKKYSIHTLVRCQSVTVAQSLAVCQFYLEHFVTHQSNPLQTWWMHQHLVPFHCWTLELTWEDTVLIQGQCNKSVCLLFTWWAPGPRSGHSAARLGWVGWRRWLDVPRSQLHPLEHWRLLHLEESSSWSSCPPWTHKQCLRTNLLFQKFLF